MMSKTYVVERVSPDTKSWESKFGPMVTYRVMFEGVQEPVEINKKPDSPKPEKGQEVFGTIQDTEYGKKFKAESNFAQGSTRSGAYKKEYKDNSDGMRQGMWFNNAAEYVNKLSELNAKVLKPTEWADTVHKYAQAGYQLGELTTEQLPGEPKEQVSLKQQWDKVSGDNFKEDTVIEDIGDEPINLEDIPF